MGPLNSIIKDLLVSPPWTPGGPIIAEGRGFHQVESRFYLVATEGQSGETRPSYPSCREEVTVADQATRTVERALALLASVCDRGGANLADTARDCGLAPSTALRLLRTLETTGFLRKDESGTYRPGSRIIQLGAQALSDESLIDLAGPAMDELATETGESVYLSVVGHAATAVYISIVEGTHSVRHASWVGRTVPLDVSAAGHALRGKVSTDGYAIVERGVETDVTAIACPVYSQARIVAALSLVIPSYRVSADQTTQYGRLLIAAAADVSARLSSTTEARTPEGSS
jgi:IclR family transcriptional regulator, acetate operon repressor